MSGIKVIEILKVKPDYDPYEEDFAGSHEGEAVELLLQSGPNFPDIKLKVQQMDSGLGPSWNVSVDGVKKFSVLYDDDGEFVCL